MINIIILLFKAYYIFVSIVKSVSFKIQDIVLILLMFLQLFQLVCQILYFYYCGVMSILQLSYSIFSLSIFYGYFNIYYFDNHYKQMDFIDCTYCLYIQTQQYQNLGILDSSFIDQMSKNFFFIINNFRINSMRTLKNYLIINSKASNSNEIEQDNDSIQVNKSEISLRHKQKIMKLSFNNICFHNSSDSNHHTSNFFKNIQEQITLNLKNHKDSLIITYGQNATGKTFHLFGTQNQKGLIECLIQKLINEEEVNTQYFVSAIRFFEYKIQDLLNLNSKINSKSQRNNSLKIKTDFERIKFKTVPQFLKLIQKAEQNIDIKYQRMNNLSMRAHIQINIIIKQSNVETQLSFIDLAGVQRMINCNSDLSKYIISSNQCVYTIQKCLLSLAKQDKYIPFRNSALTNLNRNKLQNYNLHTLFMISPQQKSRNQTYKTLKFAQQLMKSKQIINNN